MLHRFSTQAFLDPGRSRHYAGTDMRRLATLAAAAWALALAWPAVAQESSPHYRVFLSDGTALVSFGEWARVDNLVVFSMPLSPTSETPDLHLVSLPLDRVDLARTERYANEVRAARYAATHGEGDFARLSQDVATALNQVALLSDPGERLKTAERARQALREWPGAHYGYRAAEVQEIIGVLDGVIAGLQASAGKGQGQGRFDLSLSTSTEPPREPLLAPPNQAEVVQHLMTAATLVSSPVEKVSLLQSVLAMLDRAVDLLPANLASTIRSTALGGIADEQRVDGLYGQLRAATLSEASRLVERADIRSLEGLRERLRAEDQKLGSQRPEEFAAIVATLDAHLDSAHRLRLAHDQWLLRVESLRRYQRASQTYVQALSRSRDSLDDIRLLAGPAPQTLRLLAQRLSQAGRRFALVKVPAEIAAIHAVFQSAYALAESAVQLRLDAVSHADVALAKQASAAAAGAIMMLARGRADLDAAMRPPLTARAASQP
jgi:hypothetical protein